MIIVVVITDLESFNNFLTEFDNELIKDDKLELHVVCSNHKIINVTDKNSYF